MLDREGRVVRSLKTTLADPWSAVFRLWKRVPVGSLRLRIDFDLFERPHYAYCLYQSAILAQALGLPRISAIEFGVAGGRGLFALEQLASLITEETGVQIEIYGFDLGSGLPQPVDYRDLKYVWTSGYFKMDVELLNSRLTTAQLVLGDVADTVKTFIEEYRPAPIGFVAIDLDYYSSTASALSIFDSEHEYLLPRVWCYFDDIVGSDQILHCDRVGQLLAISEFKDKHEDRTLAPIHGLRNKRYRPQAWCDSVYAMHSFDHPLYDTLVGGGGPSQLPL